MHSQIRSDFDRIERSWRSRGSWIYFSPGTLTWTWLLKRKNWTIGMLMEICNEFHRRLRDLLPNAFISSVVTATSVGTRPWKRKTSKKDLSVLIRYIDQLSFLFYDTSINDQQSFENNCLNLVKDIQFLSQLRLLTTCSFLLPLARSSIEWNFRSTETWKSRVFQIRWPRYVTRRLRLNLMVKLWMECCVLRLGDR